MTSAREMFNKKTVYSFVNGDLDLDFYKDDKVIMLSTGGDAVVIDMNDLNFINKRRKEV